MWKLPSIITTRTEDHKFKSFFKFSQKIVKYCSDKSVGNLDSVCVCVCVCVCKCVCKCVQKLKTPKLCKMFFLAIDKCLTNKRNCLWFVCRRVSEWVSGRKRERKRVFIKRVPLDMTPRSLLETLIFPSSIFCNTL